MKIKNLNRACYLTVALSLILSSGAWAQNSGNPAQPIVPGSTTPLQTADQAATTVANQLDAPQSQADSTINKEVPSPDSVLTKLKQKTTPVTVNDMIAAQDVITRLDLIGQIEDKMAKIDDARAKRTQATAASVSPAAAAIAAMPNAATLPGGTMAGLTNVSAINALQQAMPKGSMPPSGMAQVLAISGTNGDYSALLQLDGHQLNVKTGSTVPGLGVVRSIDSKSVIIVKPNGKTTDVGFTQN